MAILISKESGDFTQSIWWSAHIPTHVDSKAATYVTTTAYRTSSVFTPGALTITGSGLFLANHTKSLNGKLQFELYNTSSLVSVPGTYVEISALNCPNQGWIFVYYTSSVVLAAATNYCYRVKSSVNSAHSLYTNAVVGNFSRMLITTESISASAGNGYMIGGAFLTESISPPIPINVDLSVTSSIAYGFGTVPSVTSSSFCINGHGTLSFVTSSDAFLTLSSSIDIYSSGTLNVGTSDFPIPAGITSSIYFKVGGANVNYGLNVYREGTLNMYGRPITNVYSMLESNLTASSFHVSCSSTLDWNVGDRIVVGSSTRTYTQFETGSITEIISPTYFSLNQQRIFGHSGSNPFKTEIINISRNVKVFGQSTTLHSYVYATENSIVNINGAEFYWLGSAVAAKYGFTSDQNWAGICNISHSSFHDYIVAGSRNYLTHQSLAHNLYKNVFFNISTPALHITSTSSNAVIDGMYSIACPVGGSSNSGALHITSLYWNGTLNDCILSSGAGAGIINVTNIHCNSVLSNFNIHSFGTYGINSGIMAKYNMSDFNVWRNGIYGLINGAGTSFNINNSSFIGNGTTHIYLRTNIGNINITSSNFNGDTLFSTPSGILTYTSVDVPPYLSNIKLINCTFGSASGLLTSHTTADINSNTPTFPAYIAITSENSRFMSATECALTSSNDYPSFLSILSGSTKRTYTNAGLLSKDTTAGLFAVSESIRMTPKNANFKLKSYVGEPNRSGFGRFTSVVSSGSSAMAYVKIRESVVGDGTAYNGQLARLFVEKNTIAGIDDDIVLATATLASEGAFETISGSTPIVKDNSVLNYYVDCGGVGYTGGWINVDAFDATPTNTKTLQYWKDGGPYVSACNFPTSSGTVSSETVNIYTF